MVRLKKNLWMTVFALAALAAFFAPVADAGARLVAQLDEPFEINGTVYPAGKLSLERVRVVNPISTLNEIRVDGRTVGLYLARDRPDATTALRDELIFARRSDGRLVLDSVAFAGQPIRVLSDYHQDTGVPVWDTPPADSDRTLVAASQ